MATRIINSRTATITFPQGIAHVDVLESVTNYYVTIRPLEWLGSIVEYHKVPKKAAYNMMHAAQVAYRDYMAEGNKWNWK